MQRATHLHPDVYGYILQEWVEQHYQSHYGAHYGASTRWSPFSDDGFNLCLPYPHMSNFLTNVSCVCQKWLRLVQRMVTKEDECYDFGLRPLHVTDSQ